MFGRVRVVVSVESMKGEFDWVYGIESDEAYSSNLSTVTTTSTEDEQPECEALLKSPAFSDPTFCSTLFSFAIGKQREAVVDKRRNVRESGCLIHIHLPTFD